MENIKKYLLLWFLISAGVLSSNHAKALLNAQSDLFSVLQTSCSYFLDVTANDSLGSFPPSLLVVRRQPQNGTASTNGNYLTYCPNPGFLGADNFTYLVSSGGRTDSATVYVNVLAANNFIFPGDADQNGKVENFDLLSVGLAYHLYGPARSDSASLFALAWDPSSYSNNNPGAADCNGDGIVNITDVASIAAAYHLTSPFIAPYEIDTSICRPNGIPFYIESLSGDSLMDGDTLDISIKLGVDLSINEAYGIAFTLGFDTGFISGSATQFITSQSWFLQSDTGLFFQRSFQNNGEIEIALTKTDHSAAFGGGELLRARLPIDDNIDGIASPAGWNNLNLSLRKTRLISPYNIVRDICAQQPALMVYKMNTGIAEQKTGRIRIYPNPADDLIFIEAENIREVELSDVTGRKIVSLKSDPANRIQLNLIQNFLSTGNYFVRVVTNDFVTTQKIFVQH